MRQKYSLHRVAEIAFELSDPEAIRMAREHGDYTLNRYVSILAKRSDKAKDVAKVAVDGLLDDLITRGELSNLEVLDDVDLSDEQQEQFMAWAKTEFPSIDKDRVGLRDVRNFWGIVNKCKNLKDDDPQLMVGLIFNEPGTHTGTVKYLASLGQDVEPLILEQLEAGKKVWWDSDLAKLMAEVSTAKSIPYLETLHQKHPRDGFGAILEKLR